MMPRSRYAVAFFVFTHGVQAGEAIPPFCTSCHGENGVALESETPHLNGQLRTYLVESMDALRSGKRPSKIENHLPADIDRAQIDRIAEAWSTARATRPRETTDALRVIEGRGIYLDRCTACHENNGRDTDSRGIGAPLLAGQKIVYLREQLTAYREGRRKFEVAMMGKAISGKAGDIAGVAVGTGKGKLSASDIEALAHYFASTGLPTAEAEQRRRRR